MHRYWICTRYLPIRKFRNWYREGRNYIGSGTSPITDISVSIVISVGLYVVRYAPI